MQHLLFIGYYDCGYEKLFIPLRRKFAIVMKKTFLLLSLLLFLMPAIGQSQNDLVFGPVDVMPEFPGGQRALFQFLSDNVKYPPLSVQREEEGRVIVEFIVEKNGSVDSVAVARSSGYDALDREAMRVVGLMPKWSPGKMRGETVRVKYTMPVNFRLPKEKDAYKAK